MRADREQREAFDNSMSLLEAEIKAKEGLLAAIGRGGAEEGRERKGELKGGEGEGLICGYYLS